MLALWLGLLLISHSTGLADDNKQVRIDYQTTFLTVEIAETFEQRAQGLMHRQTLCDECGMLFVFEQPRQASFWMKNTFIPLDIAYISATGEITMIAPLVPLSEQHVLSLTKVKYAWEMNRGWFANKRLKVGDKIRIRHPSFYQR